jgi:AcrR family transcriptional regulator
MVDRKEIQEQRIRSYFINAAKETLKGEGLRAVNVRSIAERAGYSYATLYNYFKDLNELIFLCVKDFTNECETFINEQTLKESAGSKRLKLKLQAFVDYFVQYPGIFDLIFVETMRNTTATQQIAEHIYLFLDQVSKEDTDYLVLNKKITEKDSSEIITLLKNTLTGLLLFYNNRMQPADYKQFIEISKTQINKLVDLHVK